jgi:hypothetical protein
VQTFLAPVDKAKLDMAPKISRNHRTDLPPDWVQRVYAFYGGAPAAIGATGSATASTSGSASGGTVAATATPSGVAVGTGDAGIPPIVYTDPGGVIIGFPGTNTITNTLVQTNLVGTNVFAGGTNVFPGGTNVFAGGTNVFPGGTNAFVGGTNVFPGAGANNGFEGGVSNVNSGNFAPTNNFTVQGSNSAQFPRTGLPAPPPTSDVLNRNQRGDTSGATAPQTVAPTETAPASGPDNSATTAPAPRQTPRPTPMAPTTGRR